MDNPGSAYRCLIRWEAYPELKAYGSRLGRGPWLYPVYLFLPKIISTIPAAVFYWSQCVLQYIIPISGLGVLHTGQHLITIRA